MTSVSLCACCLFSTAVSFREGATESLVQSSSQLKHATRLRTTLDQLTEWRFLRHQTQLIFGLGNFSRQFSVRQEHGT